jgi:hypothetical protein
LIIKSVKLVLGVVGGILKALDNERKGVALSGHYIEIDTSEEGWYHYLLLR